MHPTPPYDVIDAGTGWLDPSIFSDEQIYRDEMTKVFGRAWLMVGHESLLPNRGDFFHTYMGEEPVILSRDRNGGINALLNLCRHRGARVVRVDDGNCNSFTCSYHAWTYGLDGSLEYVPGEQEAYRGAIDKSKFGLKRARVDTYAGFVFATWAEDAPSLQDYLGDARWYLDVLYNRTARGFTALGPHKWVQPINWKTCVDNCSDFYHVPTAHVSASNAMNRVFGMRRHTHTRNWNIQGRHTFVNGHQLQYFKLPEDFPVGEQSEVTEEATERLGDFRARHVMLGTHSIFPNVVLGFRLAIPRGPLQTEFWHFALVDAGASPEAQREEARMQGALNGVAGIFEADDIDNWRQVSDSGATARGREQGQMLHMNMGRTALDETYPGVVSENFVSESNQRRFYTRWQEFMNADSWDQISLEPSTARYEGTATMNA